MKSRICSVSTSLSWNVARPIYATESLSIFTSKFLPVRLTDR